MRLMRFLWWPHCLGSCFAGDSLDTYWGFVVLGSYCLCNFPCSSLGLVLCSCRYSWGRECCSSNEGHWMNYIGVCFVLGDERCSTEGVVVEGQRFRSSYFLQIHS